MVIKTDNNLSLAYVVNSVLETHIWPVTMNMTMHYRSVNRPTTTLQIVSAINEN